MCKMLDADDDTRATRASARRLARWSATLWTLLASACASSVAPGVGQGGAGAAPLEGCALAPTECGAQTTCALDDDGLLACLPPGELGLGEACVAYLGFPPCERGLVCLQPSDADEGTCAAHCAPGTATACAEGEACAPFVTGAGQSIHLCVEPA
jgi:hypothetical protein